MTLLIPAIEHPDQDPLSWMSDEQYVAYQRLLDDELTGRYRRGITPPGMTPIPSTVSELEPPF
jgi:hypothetical protein